MNSTSQKSNTKGSTINSTNKKLNPSINTADTLSDLKLPSTNRVYKMAKIVFIYMAVAAILLIPINIDVVKVVVVLVIPFFWFIFYTIHKYISGSFDLLVAPDSNSNPDQEARAEQYIKKNQAVGKQILIIIFVLLPVILLSGIFLSGISNNISHKIYNTSK